MINDYAGAGRKQQAIDICPEPVHEGQSWHDGFRWFWMKYDAIEEKDDVDNVADKPGNVTKPDELVYLTDCTT